MTATVDTEYCVLTTTYGGVRCSADTCMALACTNTQTAATCWKKSVTGVSWLSRKVLLYTKSTLRICGHSFYGYNNKLVTLLCISSAIFTIWANVWVWILIALLGQLCLKKCLVVMAVTDKEAIKLLKLRMNDMDHGWHTISICKLLCFLSWDFCRMNDDIKKKNPG